MKVLGALVLAVLLCKHIQLAAQFRPADLALPTDLAARLQHFGHHLITAFSLLRKVGPNLGWSILVAKHSNAVA
eukprot:1159952-Pelagomonas_calceolata.AAC.6